MQMTQALHVCRHKCKTKQASIKFITTLALINMPKYFAQNLFLSLSLSLSVTRNTTKENQKHKQKNNNRDEGTGSSLQSPRRLDTPVRGQALILSTAPNVTMDDRHKLKSLFNICSKQALINSSFQQCRRTGIQNEDGKRSKK